MRCAPHGRHAPGFTLVEVIVALTATVLVAGAVYLTASTALASAERNRAVQREARTQRNARMVLTALLRSARADVVTEDAVLGWAESPVQANELVKAEDAAKVRAKAKPFVEWLKNAEDED